MPKLVFDATGEKKFESGVDHCVLYPQETGGVYPKGVAWNGITSINESPEGGDAQDFYADNIKYGTLRGNENFNGTIECYTYPDEWKLCDGRKELVKGISFGQQVRKAFGLSYRTLIGSDTLALGDAYILHLVYGATASPSSKTRSTINESPEAGTMSYEFKTTPVAIKRVENVKPAAHFEIDSSVIEKAKLDKIEAILYGSDAVYSVVTDIQEGDSPVYFGWYEKNSSGEYVPSADEEVVEGKTYYEQTSEEVIPHLPTPDEIYDILNA